MNRRFAEAGVGKMFVEQAQAELLARADLIKHPAADQWASFLGAATMSLSGVGVPACSKALGQAAVVRHSERHNTHRREGIMVDQ